MENHGRRSNYTLLTHVPDDLRYLQPPPRPSGGAALNYGEKTDSGSSWELTDRRYSDAFSHVHGVGGEVVSTASETGVGRWHCSLPSNSWARQTAKSYQFQLALALRLSSEATCVADPNFLDHVAEESESRSLASLGSVESMSHRFWVNGYLSYFDRIPDGFYVIHGMDPYVWTVCTDLQENGHIPSIESLKALDPDMDSSIEVMLIDRHSDPSLKELQNKIHVVSSNCITTKEVVDQLAKIVCNCMGGATSTGEDDFFHIWKECSNDVRKSLGSVVLPIGSLVVGLCRHRALLFKVLADRIDLPCRIAKGCKHCMRDDAASCLVRFGIDREYLVDLIGKPGCLSGPDSLLNGPSSISIFSSLCFPRFKQVGPAIDFRSLAKQYFLDTQSLNLVFEDSFTGTVFDGDARDLMYPTHSDRQFMDIRSHMPSSSSNSKISQFPFPTEGTMTNTHGRDLQLPHTTISSSNIVKDQLPPRHIPPIGHREVQPLVGLSDPRGNAVKDLRFVEGGQRVSVNPSRELSFDVEFFDIPWGDLVLKERIGAGSFGTVYRADWHGSDVAVKILMDQDFHPELLKEFLREVTITRRLRHPNIVLFMGAVTQPPNLSIVTEYLSRGSLYKLLHKPGAREMLDEKRKLNMAYDVAKGMNYLHNCSPPIVHRDLKSLNLLVDQKYTVKVCDFGLSRLKANTFLSSKTAAGTPEWMAPEVLRDEPSNEKSDIYSFGVILWELATLQPPWSNLNSAQVVAAVGFKSMRLVMPRDINPQVASIIEACWANEPWKRPSFSTIMESLRPLIKPPTSEAVSEDMQLRT
ncbi:Serine/threonine-protein kinase [Actinidia chinensis var. chinensis]|uniref:non-specific serine/threonine protein kinase n=1 Tax=Actinidia chinensis var. chinensis TaxID=1590841 RepID=A0A2R6R7S4_ACTCC|nr:Serine/threonine-protein kinase [Actinidia chinensis var. chinensis]